MPGPATYEVAGPHSSPDPGYGSGSASPIPIEVLMSNDLSSAVLIVLAVLAGIGALLWMMTALEPARPRSTRPAPRSGRGRVEP